MGENDIRRMIERAVKEVQGVFHPLSVKRFATGFAKLYIERMAHHWPIVGVKIAISLIGTVFGEEKAQACDIAWLRQLLSALFARSPIFRQGLPPTLPHLRAVRKDEWVQAAARS